MMDTLKQTLADLEVSEEIIDSFVVNGYSCVEDLKSITDYELKHVIPQVFKRKKFSQALVPWLILQGQQIDAEIALVAGLHHSQSNEIADFSTYKNSANCGISDSGSDSIKSVVYSKSTTSNECRSTSRSKEASSGTTDEDDLDLSIFDTYSGNFDHQLQREKDLEKVKNFEVPKDTYIQEKSDANSLDREKNPIWVLLSKGTVQSKRIAHLPEDTILTTSDIKEVAQIVAQYLFAEASPPKHQVTPNTCSHWATQYFQTLFPATNADRFYFIKRETYTNKTGKISAKTRPTGALYTQLCLMRKKLVIENDAAKIRTSDKKLMPEPDAPQKISRQSYRTTSITTGFEYSPPVVDNETLDSKLAALRNEAPSHASADVIEAWKETHTYRMNELKNTQGSVWDYMKLYKGLSNPAIGPILIRKDFELLFGASDTNSKLQDFLQSKKFNFINLAKECIQKLSAEVQRDLIKSFLQLIEEDDVTLQSTGALLLLPLIFPGVYQVNKHWKPTKTNVLCAFISKADTEADVQETIEKLQNHLEETKNKIKWKVNLHLQPFVLAVGPTWLEIEQAHIVMHKVVYTFPTIPEAVEVCFQLFHSFHAEYPLECHNVWEFIQKAVYGIYTEFDWNHRATSELAEQLGISLKQQSQTKLTTKSCMKK